MAWTKKTCRNYTILYKVLTYTVAYSSPSQKICERVYGELT